MKKHYDTYLKPFIGVIVLCCIGLWYWYGAFIGHPGMAFNKINDGRKNYYTVQYHILYDTMDWHFGGMNYPYGDHVVFSDNQPIYANILKFVHHHIINLQGKIIPILNLSMLFGIIITALLLCMIMLDFGLAWWYAALAATGIAFLSPQLMRFFGHYALAYSFYIPLLWLLWLAYFNKPGLLQSFIIALVIFFASLVHVYYLPIGIFFGIFMWLFYSIKYKPKVNVILLNIIIQVILPLFLFKLLLHFTDPITDRPPSPYGFTKYRAFWEGVFLPVNMQVGEWISYIKPIRPIDFENISYVGLTSTLTFICLIFLFFKAVLTGKWRLIPNVSNIPLLNISFWASFLILLFSMGIPFIAHLEWLLDYTGPMKQFRSIGRFAWVFYYIMNVYAFTAIYQLWSRNKTNAFRILILSLSLFLILYDNFQISRIKADPETERSTYSSSLPFKATDYQAILPLPFFHIGSENFGIDPRCGIFDLSADLSLKTGLPIIATQMSRTSNSETLKSLPFAMEEYRPLKELSDYKNHKPLLIILNKSCSIGPLEQQWLRLSKFIGSDHDVQFYSLLFDSINGFGKKLAEKKNYVLDSCKSKNILKQNFYYNSYNEIKSDSSYNSGGLESKLGEGIRFYNQNLNFITGNFCDVSFWAYIGHYPYPEMQLVIKEYNNEGKLINHKDTGIGSIVKAIDGNWGLVERSFDIKNKTDRFEIKIEKPDDENVVIYTDEFLLRNPDEDVYMSKPGYVYLNNRFYPLK